MEYQHFVDNNDNEILKRLGRTLTEKKMFVGTAESCTGGRIASLITSQPGSSGHFVGGIVSYDNKVKMNLLGVSAKDIETEGAVSRSVVEQMAKGAARVLGCDCAVATSGIAGPEGGSPEKPVGTVWIAAVVKRKVYSECCHFTGDRQQIIEQSARKALEMVYLMING